MPDTIIDSVLTKKLDTVLLIKWLTNESIEEASDDCILFCCSKNEFVSHFLSYIRSQTDGILQSNGNAIQLLKQQAMPDKIPSRRKHRRSVSDPTSDPDSKAYSLKTPSEDHSQESPNKDRKKSGRKVKTKLFLEESSKELSLSPDELKAGGSLTTSTPIRNGVKNESSSLVTSPVTPTFRSPRDYERSDTPRSHRHSRPQEKNLSLGDFIVTAQPKEKSGKKKRGKNTSDDIDIVTITDLDLSNSEMFPEIGARKSTSLRSERRRIKPTNLDMSSSQKSFSLNNFHLEDNVAFKHQKLQPHEFSRNFESERRLLRIQKESLMAKFNHIMTLCPIVDTTPKVKVVRQRSIEVKHSYVAADISKVVHKEQIDILVEIYDTMLKSNLILSLNTELYFLISVLLSKQYEDECAKAESQMDENNLSDYLLKSIHNSTYFAVKSLWCERMLLEIVLDKNSLKILGENKRVRGFYPDLAKFLLNAYGLKVEAEKKRDRYRVPETAGSHGVICFNFETDNADNFPSVLSFHNFKKQRDMFYEIVRWYQDTKVFGGSRSSYKARVKTLIASGPTAANHAHLAALFTAHMIAECLPPTAHESKLSKLQRRLTCPNAPETHRLPHFTEKETFYKEFILYAENDSFRVHLRDALASDIVALDSTSIATESSNGTDISREFAQLSKKLCLLGKFFGYLTSLPYSQVPVDFASKTAALPNKRLQKETNFEVPKERILQRNISLRNYSQPCVDLRGILLSSDENGRLCITVPWLVHYMAMLDYTTLRLRYYKEIIQILYGVYLMKLKPSPVHLLKKNTIIYLKSSMGWLFDLPHFPRESLSRPTKCVPGVASDATVDYHDLIDEAALLELCPFLRDVNALLLSCRPPDRRDAGSFRHITPVTLATSEDRLRNKERELQARLEEEFLKTQPSSTRRVLELVMERVTSGTVKELTAQTLTEFRKRAREKAACLVAKNAADSSEELRKAVEALYSEQLQQLRAEALAAGGAAMRGRAATALAALLPAAPGPLLALALKGCRHRLDRWLSDNWSTTAVLCKDIEEETKTLIALGEAATITQQKPVDLAAMMLPDDKFEAIHVSPAAAVINLKEQICLMLEGSPAGEPGELLPMCALACSPANLFSRPPTQRAILQLSLDYCIVFVSRRPEDVNEAFMAQLHAVWDACCPERRPGENGDEAEEPPAQPATDEAGAEGRQSLEPFERVLCPRNVALLTEARRDSAPLWRALASVLLFLLEHDYLSEDSLTEQCLAVYRQDLPQNILENLSMCMKIVSSRWASSSAGKFTLFLDFLAEYCGDMEFDPIE